VLVADLGERRQAVRKRAGGEEGVRISHPTTLFHCAKVWLQKDCCKETFAMLSLDHG
jgi:hypothetical protein